MGRKTKHSVDLDAIDVVVKDGLPTFQHPDGQPLFGSFVDRPSEDGMMMAKFPGLPEPIEVPMVFPGPSRGLLRQSQPDQKTKEL